MPPTNTSSSETSIETNPAWAFHSVRPAALSFPDAAADEGDEFLGWFLGVARDGGNGTGSPRPHPGRNALLRLSTRLPKLPDAEAVHQEVEAWARKDRHLSDWLAAGLPAGRALTRWGMEQIRARRLPQAVAAFRGATALTPGDPGAWSNYGVALDMSQTLPEASACLERSLFLFAGQPHTWLQLGLVRKKLGDPTSAEAAYRTALEQEPGNAAAWQCLGLLKEEQSDFAGAIDCFLACIAHGGGNPVLSANLGKLCYRIGRLVEAQQAYAEAVRGAGDHPGFQFMLRKLTFMRHLIDGGSVETAIADFRDGHPDWNEADQKEFREIFDVAFGVLSGFGHKEAARRVGRKHAELWPGDPTMQYLLQALEGGAVDRSPPGYIIEHFDRFAASFDAQLVGTLGYDLPRRIGEAVQALLGGNQAAHALDAGCGTGLCGPELRPAVRRLTGVDLSSRMLERAEQRGVYDSLVCEDLLGYLGRSARAFDLIVAADVLIYFGDLGNVLTSAALALRPGGWLIFSTESFHGTGYQLLPTGRFAHASAHVEQAAHPEFALHSRVRTTLRLEGTTRVPGHLFVFRRL